MEFQLLVALDVIKVCEVFLDDDFKFPNMHRVARTVHMMAHVISIALTTLLAILAEVFQHAVIVALVPAITIRARTAAVNLVTRTCHVTRACWARVFAVLAICPVITELK